MSGAPACRTRLYGFDSNGNRINVTRREGNPDGTCSSSGGTSTGWTYDAADRLITGGNAEGEYSYDALGRVVSMPGSDSRSGASAGSIGLAYYDTDAVASVTQAGITTSFGIDPIGRRSTELSGITGGISNTTVRRYYTDPTDNPTWVEATSNGSAIETRFVEGLSGGLVGEVSSPGIAQIYIANPRGDIVTAVELPSTGPATGISGWTDAEEYGAISESSKAQIGGQLDYTWLGSGQRETEDSTGLTLMGARVCPPNTGQFLSPDPIYSGNDTSNAYPADPINDVDLTGCECNRRQDFYLAVEAYDRGWGAWKPVRRAHIDSYASSYVSQILGDVGVVVRGQEYRHGVRAYKQRKCAKDGSGRYRWKYRFEYRHIKMSRFSFRSGSGSTCHGILGARPSTSSVRELQ